MTYMIGVI